MHGKPSSLRATAGPVHVPVATVESRPPCTGLPQAYGAHCAYSNLPQARRSSHVKLCPCARCTWPQVWGWGEGWTGKQR